MAALFVALAIPARAQSDQPTQNAQLDQTPQKKPDQTPQKKSGEKPTLLKGAVQSTKHDPKASMLVNADELVHNYHENLVSAVGHVQIYYEGAVLEADRVTFDRNTNRLHAQGNVRYRTKDGKVLYGEVIELDKDFKEGFANSLLIETPQKTHFAAARADRTNGNTTVFQSGIYTACQACKDDPTKPPLWQVKAQRIIHKEDERIIYYENAVFEIFGQPVLNIPMFWHPDPTVKRQSGFLVPHAFSSSKLGVGVEEPYFWAIAPDKDITFAAVPLTNQGVLGKIEYRQRFLTGAFTVKASGIIQSDPGAFNLSPTSTAINLTGGTAGAGTRTNRGAIESTGQFDINKQWVWGWDGVLTTDRTYLNDYNTLTQEHANEKVSQLYLVGQGDRSYFDMRGMSFLGMSELDRNNEQPVIHPVLDYNYIYGQPVLGGELGFTMNFASLSRQEAEFDAINQAALNSDFCDSRAIVLGKTNPTNCVMRGAPGDYTRGTFQLDWKRTITNSIGMMFTPFVRLRTDAAYANISNANGVTSLFMPTGGDSLVRAMPAIGLETRWPFISVHEWGTQTLEPIAQVIVRPNETQIGKFPNEDSQSLVFSDANLFAIDKYSGFDRVEGGTRANVGVQYTMNINRFGTINAMFGQSYQLAGLNSFSVTDATNIGLESGLDHNVSDYVARLYYQPTNNLSFTTRYLFDRDTFALNRFEAEATTIWDRLKLTTTFASYQAQPLIGFLTRREGIYQTAAYNFDKHWSVTGGIRYDLDLNHTDLYTVGVNYLDECFALMATYTYDDTNFLIQKPDHRFMARINLRTLSSPDTPTGITTLGPTAGTSVMTTPN
ncbi:MAG TPA: LPS-assembly protein LptD [Xanthobacteraceae bacterium]|nr:LPS-assembly protein LptD [Xanthobacteraceae bacterium]